MLYKKDFQKKTGETSCSPHFGLKKICGALTAGESAFGAASGYAKNPFCFAHTKAKEGGIKVS